MNYSLRFHNKQMLRGTDQASTKHNSDSTFTEREKTLKVVSLSQDEDDSQIKKNGHQYDHYAVSHICDMRDLLFTFKLATSFNRSSIRKTQRDSGRRKPSTKNRRLRQRLVNASISEYSTAGHQGQTQRSPHGCVFIKTIHTSSTEASRISDELN